MRNGKPSRRKPTNVLEGSGNVFADLGLPHPDELLAKAKLVRQVDMLIEKRGLSQRRAAALLGISRSSLAELLCGDVDLFSMDRLLRFLNALDQEVEIVVRPKRRGKKLASTCVVVN